MGVLDEITSAPREPLCSLAKALAALPAEADEFRSLLYEPRYATFGEPGFITSQALHQAFKRRGLEVSDQMIRRHRRSLCACQKGQT